MSSSLCQRQEAQEAVVPTGRIPPPLQLDKVPLRCGLLHDSEHVAHQQDHPIPSAIPDLCPPELSLHLYLGRGHGLESW